MIKCDSMGATMSGASTSPPAGAARAAVAALIVVNVLLAGGLAVVAGGCGTPAAAAVPARGARELVLAYDGVRATGTLAFPSSTYESVVRFELPEGEHRPLRLRFLAEAGGKVEITIYDSTILETPGQPLRTWTRELAQDDLSDGHDGHWVVEELVDMKPLKGVVWVGVRKCGGEPTIWASSVASGQAFIRNSDPQNFLSLLPTKRTPMLRLELAR
jgi:hypothetical protein